MIQFEPVYLPVRLFSDQTELHRALELLRQYRIPAKTEQFITLQGVVIQITVQPVYAEYAREILSEFSAESVWLIKHDPTLLWAAIPMLFILFPALLIFPLNRDPMTVMLIFSLSLLPGIAVGQKKIVYHCSLCGTANEHGAEQCSHCRRTVKGTVSSRKMIPADKKGSSHF